MLRNLPLFILLFFSGLASAQSFTLGGDSENTGDATSSQIKVLGTITNNTNASIELRWYTVEENLPSASWQTLVCDPVQCWSPVVVENTFMLPANATEEMSTYFQPLGVEGVGTVDIHIYELADSVNSHVTKRFTGITTNAPVSINDQEQNKIQIYPNPAINYIMISNPGESSYISLFNVVGKQVKLFRVNHEHEKFDISDLTQGIYIVRLHGNDGQILSTQRFSKRTP